MATLTWDSLKKVAHAALRKKGLNGIYSKRLDFELTEIEKQGANGVWVDHLSDPHRHWNSNPNNLLLPWLFNRVKQDPINGREKDVITTTKYAKVVKIIEDRGGIPPELTLDTDKPDVDIDCLPEARDEIKKFAYERYSAGIDDGYGAVCSVSTWSTYLLRSAIQDVAKATGWCTKQEAIELTTNLPDDVDELKENGAALCSGKWLDHATGIQTDCHTLHTLTNCPKCGSPDTESPTIGKLLVEQPMLTDFYAKYPKVIDIAVRLVGRIRSMGKHAGALIIADRPLFGNLPLYRRAGTDEGEWISIWTEGRNPQLSKFGFTKWDVLGLKTLRYIDECCLQIEANHGISFGKNLEGWNDIDPEVSRAGHYFDANGERVDIDLNDPTVLQMASESRTEAVFQFDTALAQRTLSNGVRSFNDLMVLNAMGHPGPIAMIPEWVERRDDPNELWRRGEHPEVVEVLKDTFSTIVFQEQLQALWQRLAGFTATEAQEARKAVAKKWVEKLKPIENKWVAGASKTMGKEVAENWWTKMQTFGRYAFNKSHAVAYCLVAYRCLWLKCYFPHEWWAAVMSYCNQDKLIRYMNSARAEGVQLGTIALKSMAPRFKATTVRRQRHDQGIPDGTIAPALLGIKGIGESIVEKFAIAGEYESIDDFVAKRGQNKILMERLIKLGAFKGFLDHDNIKAAWHWYQYQYCSDTDSRDLRKQINAACLAAQGWDEGSIAKERARQEAEFRQLYPKRKVIPKKILNWQPAPGVTLAMIKALYPEDYTLTETLAQEEQFLGYTIHSPLDQFVYKGNRTIEQAKTDGEVEAVINNVLKGRTKTLKPMMKLTLTDGRQEAILILWEDQLVITDPAIVKKGVAIRAMVDYDRDRNNFTVKRSCPIIRLRKRDGHVAAG